MRRRGVAAARGRARSDPVYCRRVQLQPSRFFSSGRYCTICACDCGREETRLKSTISVRQRRESEHGGKG